MAPPSLAGGAGAPSSTAAVAMPSRAAAVVMQRAITASYGSLHSAAVLADSASCLEPQGFLVDRPCARPAAIMFRRLSGGRLHVLRRLYYDARLGRRMRRRLPRAPRRGRAPVPRGAGPRVRAAHGELLRPTPRRVRLAARPHRAAGRVSVGASATTAPWSAGCGGALASSSRAGRPPWTDGRLAGPENVAARRPRHSKSLDIPKGSSAKRAQQPLPRLLLTADA